MEGKTQVQELRDECDSLGRTVAELQRVRDTAQRPEWERKGAQRVLVEKEKQRTHKEEQLRAALAHEQVQRLLTDASRLPDDVVRARVAAHLYALPLNAETHLRLRGLRLADLLVALNAAAQPQPQQQPQPHQPPQAPGAAAAHMAWRASPGCCGVAAAPTVAPHGGIRVADPQPGGGAAAAVTQKVKLVLLGASGSGKTSAVVRLVEGKFSDGQMSTLGVGVFHKHVRSCDVERTLEIWDTAGQEVFRSILPMYYRKAQIAVLVYDVSDARGPGSVSAWFEDLARHITPVVIAVIGNKVDLGSVVPHVRLSPVF
eukprot:TRINITY_DN5801_c0_g2_i1.p1 TRINITY_DN5801_c0_g2~~TRINITY_DN5801_c0_g2_i1.p1  ORF type:complete len:315 (-),score=55.25 TRINITY_DN5801_c0_g2_i1:237-1181(-)